MFASFLLISNFASASITNGTIDTTFHYAWGENIGWVDFANILITDTALSGSAYGENIGWIDLSTITNDGEGALSGYAWGENVGWVDFSAADIGSDGVFTGGAYGENIGWITFGTGDNKVATDWRPASVRPSSSSGSKPKIQTEQKYIPVSNTATVCKTGEKFSTVTGLPCVSYESGTTQSCTVAPTLKLGSKGENVKCLQTKLTGLVADGVFGPKTKTAVIVFQTTNKLKIDGIVGPFTSGVINSLIK